MQAGSWFFLLINKFVPYFIHPAAVLAQIVIPKILHVTADMLPFQSPLRYIA
jgi:hypothetical protein